VDRETVEVDTKKGMPVIGKHFKQDRQQVLNALASLTREEVTAMETQLKDSGYDAYALACRVFHNSGWLHWSTQFDAGNFLSVINSNVREVAAGCVE